MHKVIFDTDPGVDDAMALLFLHAAAEVELIGITTTFGNGTIETTTRNALYIAERFGIAAPVAQGAGVPLVGDAGDPPHFVHGHNGLGDIELPATLSRQPDPRPAHRLIIDLIRANPGEVEIVAVGRMTNLALALREDPGIAGLVKQVVVMGGAFGIDGVLGNVTPAAEANIWGDPLAADEVTGAAWPLTMVGLDVTQKTRMPTEYLRTIADEAGEAGRFIWDISRFYEDFHQKGGVDSIFVHDSSAVAYLLDPTLFEIRRGEIRVVSEGLAFGQTIQKPAGTAFPPSDWDGRPVHQICTSVDSDALRRLYQATLRRLA
ncbi:nucleoside hydrolase [Devosia sp.]|uniref:nucleoside hydrolase n=1 Tax=Devosia sp. TaxID=1871048 RepID=UPI0037BF3A10